MKPRAGHRHFRSSEETETLGERIAFDCAGISTSHALHHADAIDGTGRGVLSSAASPCGSPPPQVREENGGILSGAAFRPDAPDFVRDIGDHLSDAAPRAR